MRPGPELAQGNLGFSGLLSVVGGVLLGITPLIGALVLTWWLGAYALVFGGTFWRSPSACTASARAPRTAPRPTRPERRPSSLDEDAPPAGDAAARSTGRPRAGRPSPRPSLAAGAARDDRAGCCHLWTALLRKCEVGLQ